ncbi:membrane-associated progesterone receptor component 1-like [Anneissia japonica]|uniref:membrane-associated progesterone receptor component 1-like n=1 Tax=Anneissia japonica TaxID=1529436 RepID=UPI0014257A04|nr:membrane-associated progesterone receptor component 1-like [Anneissia japonica]
MAVKELLTELLTSPVNLVLLATCFYLLYKILFGNAPRVPDGPKEPVLEKMKKRDMTLKELSEYDGTKHDGRILVAVNGKVFDVTRGKRFYGPDGPYGVFAGHDASRALATFSLEKESFKDEVDDLTDLDEEKMESVREWEMQFFEKYEFVGKLLKPNEEPTDYSDEEASETDKTEDKCEKDKQI